MPSESIFEFSRRFNDRFSKKSVNVADEGRSRKKLVTKKWHEFNKPRRATCRTLLVPDPDYRLARRRSLPYLMLGKHLDGVQEMADKITDQVDPCTQRIRRERESERVSEARCVESVTAYGKCVTND